MPTQGGGLLRAPRAPLSISPRMESKMSKVLNSGIDSLNFSLDVVWKNSDLFNYLTELKKEAKEKETELPGILKGNTKDEDWLFLLKQFGAGGYEWILLGKEFTLKIGKWEKPHSKPGVLASIRSETLWSKGVKESCNWILKLIEMNGAEILTRKVSRADLCLDIMLDEKEIGIHLTNHITKKAKKWGFIMGASNEVETIEVGTRKAALMARIYDKPQEIKERGKKEWMYEIWKIKECPSGKKIFRIEFQLNREAVKEMGVGVLDEFIMRCDEVWAYCTQKWLRFDKKKNVQHRDIKVMKWWKEVQNGFYGVQSPFPAIRKKAIKEDAEQLRSQIIGTATSLTALVLEDYEFDYDESVNFETCIGAVLEAYKRKGNSEDDFKKLLLKKRAKYFRSREV